jgi:tetratricopeptide (TPR) repeat protein
MNPSEPSGNSEAAERALEALRDGHPEEAAEALLQALREDPERVDLMHALAVTQLRRGFPRDALEITVRGEEMAQGLGSQAAEVLIPQFLLARAAACEDLYDPDGAHRAFKSLLQIEPGNPRAQQGLGHLLLGWGRTDEGLQALDHYLAEAMDEPDFLTGTQDFVDALKALIRDDIHPRVFLEAHRGSYLDFFDHHANKMEAEGWISEAARMMKDPSGQVVPIIPEGARPYAAVRVDLVNPATGQPGQIGDQPMVVAVAGYEPLAQAPVLVSWPVRDHPFALYICTQAPWDQLPIQVAFADPEIDAVHALDGVIGDWYTAGYDGAFGSQTRGRLHTISDPEEVGPGAVLYHVDLGRADQEAIDNLLHRLLVVHDQQPIRCVVLGRGYLPSS